MTSLLRSRGSVAVSVLAPLALIGSAVLVGASAASSLRETVTMVLCQLIIVIGMQVFIGNSGIYSFGQLGFAGLGAYAAALTTLPAAFAALQTPSLPHWIVNAQPTPILGVLIAAAICAVLAALVGLPLMRTSTLAIPISTFAFLIVVYNVLANWDPVTGGSGGLLNIPRTTALPGVAAAAALVTLLALAYKRSSSGYRLIATRENEIAARSLGIGVFRERLLAFILSAAICGVGGALAVHQAGVLLPSTFYFGATVTTLTMLVVGGTQSVFGAVLGSLAVAAVNESLLNLEARGTLFGLFSIGSTPGLAAIGVGLILLATIVALPRGLSGGREAGELWPLGHSRPQPKLERLVAATRPAARASAGEAGLWAENIAVEFGGLRALRGVSLRLAPGGILGLIGPNGAGKTTLLNVLSGFQRPDSGQVYLDGVEVSGLPPAQLARNGLGRTFQGILPFSGLSGLESVAVGAMGMGHQKQGALRHSRAILSELELSELAQVRVGALPPAKQRLLGIARALAAEPRYLLLDEPAAGLDEGERDHLVALLTGIRERSGCGLVLVEHELSVVGRVCSSVQVLDGGLTLRLGTPSEVQADPTVAAAYLGDSYMVGTDA